LKNGKSSSGPKAADLKSLSILLGDACEAVTLEVDQKGLLAKGEWAFSLDTESDEFKAEMGPRWAGVTWRILLAKDGELNLWQLAKAVSYFLSPPLCLFANILTKQWKPDALLWEQDKREICNTNQEVKMMWHIAERVRHYHPTAGRTAELLKGGDGKIYLGPSKPLGV
jgi:hypothetical protein